MREIKFQGIYRPTGEKFEARKIDTLNKFVYASFDGKKNDYCHYSTEPNGKGDAWLREFTGLSDKHGVEIYEGDIIKSETLPNRIGEVYPIKDIVEFHYIMLDSAMTPSDAEVIGNVYENPDLLKG